MKHFASFPLFSNHLELAHQHWKRLLCPGDLVIDATCGNGHDTLALIPLIQEKDSINLIAFDVQKKALESTKALLCESLNKDLIDKIRFIHGSHENFPQDIEQESVKLIIYNLGYLPGGDKSLTTLTSSTLLSLQNALPLIKKAGAISITCYPGHTEGKVEEKAILEFTKSLDPRAWSCCHHRWLNRNNSPSLLLIQRNL